MNGARFVLLGHPVAHSLSPVLHRAAYRARNLSCEYELLDVPDPQALEVALDRLRRGVYQGANVTVPWKREALARADERESSAASVGAANVLVRSAEGRLIAANTDVAALVEELGPLGPGGGDALVLGAGGAARAAVAALRELGFRIAVSARRFTGGAEIERPFLDLGATTVPWPPREHEAAHRARVVVQATSAGMYGAEPGTGVAAVVPWEALAARARAGVPVLALDLVYAPRVTPFLAAARAHGLPARDGLGMLVAQAALAFARFLGGEPPRAEMARAVEGALACSEGR